MKTEIPIEVGMSGHYDIEVYDTVQKKVTKRRSSKNMLLDDYMDKILQYTNDVGIIVWKNDPTSNENRLVGDKATRCYLGDNGTAVTASDPYVHNQVGDYKEAHGGLTEESPVQDNPSWRKLTWSWPAGEYVGMIREIGIRVGRKANIARQTISPELNLLSNEELWVSWTLYVDLGTRIFSGTISEGQRNSTDDIDWTLTINNNQLHTFLDNFNSRYQTKVWFFTGGLPPNAKIGDSNVASNLTADGRDDIKGTQLYNSRFVESFNYSPPYAAGSYERESTQGLEHDSPSNVQIGEITIGNRWSDGLFRVTFNPKLDKAEYYRLYITFKFKVVRV